MPAMLLKDRDRVHALQALPVARHAFGTMMPLRHGKDYFDPNGSAGLYALAARWSTGGIETPGHTGHHGQA